MGRLRNVNIATQYSPAVDAFGSFRTSQTHSVFESKFIYDKQPLLWAERLTGSGSAVHTPAQAAVRMRPSDGATAGTSIRQSRVWSNYQPGRSQKCLFTFVFGQLATDHGETLFRIGQFNDDNGLFLQQGSAGMGLVRRTNVSGTPVDNAVAQGAWNGDRLDGTGVSGLTIDWMLGQLMVVDYTWLGFGSIRISFIINGVSHLAHTIHTSNVLDRVWTSSPNLPVRYSGQSTVATGEYIDQICSTVLSEGGVDIAGYLRSISPNILAADETQMSTAGLKYAVHGIRLKSTHLGATINIHDAHSIVTSSNSPFKWELHLNPTLAGTAVVWSDVLDSAIQSGKTGAGTATTVSVDGHVIASGYGTNNEKADIVLESMYPIIGSDVDGNRDTVFLVLSSAGGNDDGLGVIAWTELY